AGVFYTPLDETAEENMAKSFQLLTENLPISTTPILICHRLIPIVKQADRTIWFEFNVICNVPRSQRDYLEIAEKYQTVFISNIPQILATEKNTINLFIRMIDI